MNSEKQEKQAARKAGFYIAVLVLAVAVVLSVALCIYAANKPSVPTGKDDTEIINPDDGKTDDNKQDEEPVVKPVLFNLPIEGSVAMAYSEVPVYNETLGRFAAHKAIDYKAESGTKVVAVYEGTVTEVTESVTKGVSVKIDHGNGLFTVYNSIEPGENIKVGTMVAAGDKIGIVSDTNRQEAKTGAHLHFETIENGKLIDPAKYFVAESK